MKSSIWKYLGVSVLVLVVLYVVIGFFWAAGADRASNGVVRAVRNCQSTLTEGYKAVKGTQQINVGFQAYSKDLFASALAGNGDSTTKLVTLISTQAKTDYSATATQVQRVIEAQTRAFTLCQTDFGDQQLVLSNSLTGFGFLFNFLWNKPNELAAGAPSRPEKDVDGDGKITALDYPTVTAGFAREATKTGEDPGQFDLSSQSPTQ